MSLFQNQQFCSILISKKFYLTHNMVCILKLLYYEAGFPIIVLDKALKFFKTINYHQEAFNSFLVLKFLLFKMFHFHHLGYIRFRFFLIGLWKI